MPPSSLQINYLKAAPIQLQSNNHHWVLYKNNFKKMQQLNTEYIQCNGCGTASGNIVHTSFSENSVFILNLIVPVKLTIIMVIIDQNVLFWHCLVNISAPWCQIVFPIPVLKPWFQDASFEYHEPYFTDNLNFDL